MNLRRTLSTLLWLPLNLVQGTFTALWTAGWISLALLVSLVGGPRPALALARHAWAPGLLGGAGARLSVRGLEQVDLSRAHFLVANHQSWIDIPALFRALPLPLHFLAKRELAAVPFLGWYIRAMGMVFVERRDPRAGRASVGRAADLLASGKSVLSFPEGTRSRDGRIGEFKSGAFGAALAAGVAVVPIGLVGTGRVLPRVGFRVRPGVIEVRIGAPIDVAPYAPFDRAGLARAAEAAVAELLGEPAPVGRKRRR
jgi:1-acyl-sn-glycerol-3-phosphate acyltransferase